MAQGNVEAVVRRYYAVVGDHGATEDDLAALLHPELRVVEHPNAINPQGTVRDRDETLAGYVAGKALLADQAFEVAEVLVDGDRAAVRATWSGTLGRDLGPLKAGAALKAHIASLLTVADGLIRAHETFDCYDQLPVA
jgi:ketosteroid isomerase-like protein